MMRAIWRIWTRAWRKRDYWEMLLPSQYAAPSDLLEKLAGELELQRRGRPLALLQELNARLYRTL